MPYNVSVFASRSKENAGKVVVGDHATGIMETITPNEARNIAAAFIQAAEYAEEIGKADERERWVKYGIC